MAGRPRLVLPAPAAVVAAARPARRAAAAGARRRAARGPARRLRVSREAPPNTAQVIAPLRRRALVALAAEAGAEAQRQTEGGPARHSPALSRLRAALGRSTACRRRRPLRRRRAGRWACARRPAARAQPRACRPPRPGSQAGWPQPRAGRASPCLQLARERWCLGGGWGERASRSERNGTLTKLTTTRRSGALVWPPSRCGDARVRWVTRRPRLRRPRSPPLCARSPSCSKRPATRPS